MWVGNRIRTLYDRTLGRLGRRGRWYVATAALGAFSLGGGVALGSWTHLCDDCPSIAQIYAFEPKEATRLYAGDGSLLAELAVERRTPIKLDDLPPHVYEPFVAVEDRRFWTHHGVDPKRTVRAFVDFVLHGYGAAGGSTITQQLAGNMFTRSVDRREISIRRKLREIKVALALERAYTKQEILEAYLNQINFDGVYGIQAAARRYFGKDAADLNLPEASLLAALPRSPARYNPTRHPESALRRRNLILGLLANQGSVTPAEAAAARAFPLQLRTRAGGLPNAPYFVEWVRRILYKRYGTSIYERGLRVYTTLDPALQEVADSALHAQLDWVERQPAFSAPTYAETREWSEDRLKGPEMPYVQGMFVALKPGSGDVLAMIGGRDFKDSEFNRATQALRQPGSVFKPFTYTAAIVGGIPASEVIYDTPVVIEQPGSPPYSPRNFDGKFHGPMTLREAIARSINVVAVKLGQRVGVESMAQIAHRMGVTSDIPRVPSAPIGSASVTPMELVKAYTTFANVGTRVTPRPILRIEEKDGRVLWESRVERERVLDQRTAWIMLSMLRDVVDQGTGRSAIRVRAGVPYTVPVAGKTGTTNDATDAWFMGFTPEIVTATWIGFDRPARLHRNAQGGIDAAPVNGAVLAWYYRDRDPPLPWPRPPGLVERRVDRTTGLLATEWCPAKLVYTEVYLPGTEPTETCDVHGPWGIRQSADTLDLPLRWRPQP
ncbi:MAG: penicillin-binding protein 1A [Gemmatimonadota bacterium]